MAEIDYYEALGVERPTGEKEQEPAEPAQHQEPEGAKEQTAAESAGADTKTEDDGGSAAEQKGTAAEETSAAGGQSPEDNAKFAAARRKAEAERDEAIRKAKAEADEEAGKAIKEAFEAIGMTNPYTGKPIRSREDLDAYKKAYAEDRKAQTLKRTGMSEEEYQKLIDADPRIQKANEVVQKATEQMTQASIKAQLEEIQKLDPDVKDLQSLQQMETYKPFYDLVQKGYSFVDAFKLANEEAIKKRWIDAARQQTLNGTSGKDHLRGIESQGEGEIQVPPDVMKNYRIYMPNATDEEIRKHYRTHHKK